MIKSDFKLVIARISMKSLVESPARSAEKSKRQTSILLLEPSKLTQSDCISKSSDLHASDCLQHKIHLRGISRLADKERVATHRFEARLTQLEQLLVTGRQQDEFALLGLSLCSLNLSFQVVDAHGAQLTLDIFRGDSVDCCHLHVAFAFGDFQLERADAVGTEDCLKTKNVVKCFVHKPSNLHSEAHPDLKHTRT